MPSYPIPLRGYLTLSSHLRLVLPNDLLPSGSLNKKLLLKDQDETKLIQNSEAREIVVGRNAGKVERGRT
jgi:hypothetical protein